MSELPPCPFCGTNKFVEPYNFTRTNAEGRFAIIPGIRCGDCLVTSPRALFEKIYPYLEWYRDDNDEAA